MSKRTIHASLAAALAAVIGSTPLHARAGEPRAPRTVLRAPWGAAPGALGKRDAQESAPEGPESFAAGADGALYVVDQVNERVALFERGRPAALIPLDGDAFQDIAVTRDGALVLVDRFQRRSVLVIGADGARVREDALLRPGIEEGGGVTALLPAPDGVWAEIDHARSVRVVDDKLAEVRAADGEAVAVPGRPVGDRGLFAGAKLAARDETARTIDVWLTDPKADLLVATAKLRFADPVDRISLVAQDDAGDVVVAVHTMVETAPGAIAREALLVVRLDEHLAEVSRFKARPSSVEHEQRREFFLAADGTVYQMRFDARGVEVLAWSR